MVKIQDLEMAKAQQLLYIFMAVFFAGLLWFVITAKGNRGRDSWTSHTLYGASISKRSIISFLFKVLVQNFNGFTKIFAKMDQNSLFIMDDFERE